MNATQPSSTRRLRYWLGAALALNLLLAAAIWAMLHGYVPDWMRTPAATANSVPQRSPGATAAKPPNSSGAATPGIAGMGKGTAPATHPTPLAPFQLSPERLQSIGVRTGIVTWKNIEQQLHTVGNVATDERREATIETRFPGWIQKTYVNARYQKVRHGQPLFTIYSPQLLTTEREFLLAQANAAQLAHSPIAGVSAGARSLLNAARQRLRLWQVPQQEIARLERTKKVSEYLTFDSPASGYVTKRNALPNQYVQPSTELYSIADLSTVWIYAQVFQNQIGMVRSGDRAQVTVDAYPGRNFAGRVDKIWPLVDPATRTVRVRLVFRNPRLKLLPGMFVNVELRLPLGRHLVVPESAILETGTRALAFVDRGQGRIEPRTVKLGAEAQGDAIVLGGLRAGERVVTSADFLIASESQLAAALGSFAPPPPGAGAAAEMQPGTAARLTLKTSPLSLRRGSNQVQVHLSTAAGKPLAGARVTVSFFMPAMPAMGMSAMRTKAVLSDLGGGDYAGKVRLKSAGTWQVSIVATRHGKTVAQQQMQLNAQ